MRILALVPDAFGGKGGIAQYMRDVFEALALEDEVSSIVVLPRNQPQAFASLPEKVVQGEPVSGSSATYVFRALGAALRTRPAVIICGHINLLPLALLLRGLARAPVILAIYGIDAWSPTPSRFVNLLAPRVDAVLAISTLTLERFQAWAGRSAASFVVPNAIRLDQYGCGPKRPDLLHRYGLERAAVIMTLGRLEASERYKGVDEVLEVLPRIIDRNPEVRYLVVGDGSDRPRLEAKAAALGLVPYAVFAGSVVESEKADHYRLADAFVMPSRGEGFGFVFLEAMACGIPVVASRLDGSREAVMDGSLGALVDPNNQDELHAAICSALAEPKRVKEGLAFFAFPKFRERISQVVGRVRRP